MRSWFHFQFQSPHSLNFGRFWPYSFLILTILIILIILIMLTILLIIIILLTGNPVTLGAGSHHSSRDWNISPEFLQELQSRHIAVDTNAIFSRALVYILAHCTMVYSASLWLVLSTLYCSQHWSRNFSQFFLVRFKQYLLKICRATLPLTKEFWVCIGKAPIHHNHNDIFSVLKIHASCVLAHLSGEENTSAG